MSDLVERLRAIADKPIAADMYGRKLVTNDLLREAADRIAHLERVVAAADAMRKGEDCPMCDNGKLRNPAKEHWDTCAFAAYDAVRKGEG